jgi:hypothetical protein
MKLYTLISIALGVFGGTYSALAALRTHFEAMIKEARQQAETHLKKIADHYGPNAQTTKNCQERHKGINRSASLWNWCNTIPAILFAIFVFFIAAWVLADWDTICSQAEKDTIDRTKFPWTWFYRGLVMLVVIDFLCFISAAIAWGTCKWTSRVLRHHHEAVLDEESRAVSPLAKTP